MKLWYNEKDQDYLISSDNKTLILNLCIKSSHDTLPYLINKIENSTEFDLNFHNDDILIAAKFEDEYKLITEFKDIEYIYKIKETHPECFI